MTATDLAGVKVAAAVKWPGAIHEGNGNIAVFVDAPGNACRAYGQRLLMHDLAAIDEEGAAAYRDGADELVSLYLRFGFRVIGSFFLPDGQRSNGMWRSPSGGRLH